ncbi:MAG: L-seryl-tRNA(Sec) selenium transferase [Verrucomicrobiota bacterium]|jgi:L-seryl-tRNA(Ser) seleniumtransferase
MPDQKQELLRALPAITDLLKSETAAGWLRQHPQPLVTECLRRALAGWRRQILDDAASPGGTEHLSVETVLAQAEKFLQDATEPRLREAINATGIILHTGLGRAVLSAGVVDSMMDELKGYCTLAVDRASGERAGRDELVEYILTELTGAEAATVVNNNAAATLLALAALAAPKEVIVSRGQLIEIGGSFRLPEVMAQSGARLVEVGATNRTHLKDYQRAVTENTAAILRAHPSNYRVVGFTSEVALRDLAELAHGRNLILMDDLGAGALVDLKRFGLPHEPTARESIEAGADVVLFSGDKLIGAGQCGVIVGRKALIERLRQHPLMRAVRVDKICLMVLERTLHLFRDPARLAREHPIYRMISTPPEELKSRAQELARLISAEAPKAGIEIAESEAFLGSGSLPTEAIPSFVVTVSLPEMSAAELARRLRLDRACVFGRIENDRVCLDVRTLTGEQVPAVAAAFGRLVA